MQAVVHPAPPDIAVTVHRVRRLRGRRALTALPDLVAPAVAGFSVPAMVLLLLDSFVVPVALVLGTGGAAIAVTLVLRHRSDDGEDGDVDERGHALAWTALAVVIAGVFFFVNARYAAQDLYLARDPGTYTVAGEWLSHHREAMVPADSDVFGSVPWLYPDSPGFARDSHEPDMLFAQGNHLLPALLAVGGWTGGPEVLLRVNALIGALALLAAFGLLRRMVGGAFALAAVAALAVSMPMVHFSRDNYTEPLTLLLLFGGLSLLWQAVETRRPSHFLVAGVTMGASAMARIDAYAALVAVVAAAVGMLAVARAGERRACLVSVAWLAAGTAVVAWLGYADVTRLSSGYYTLHRDMILPLVYAAIGLLALGAVVVVLTWRGVVPRRLFDASARRRWAGVAAVLVVVGFAVLASRPMWMQASSGCSANMGVLQRGLGLEVDPCRSYTEQSVSWFAWHYGWPALVLGVLGLALLTYRVVRDGDLRLLGPVAAILALCFLYFVRPSIYPDQIWVMRRFLPVVIPGLLAGAAYALRSLWRRRGAGRAGFVGGLAILALAGLLVAWPAMVTRPVWSVRTGVPQLDQVEGLCDHLGDDAAVLTLGLSEIGSYTQTVRSFCGVPSQVMPEPSQAQLAEVRSTVHAGGRTLYVMAERPGLIPYQSRAAADPPPLSAPLVKKLPERLDSVPRWAIEYVVPLYLGEVNEDGTVRPVT